jgi:hypothetical protein
MHKNETDFTVFFYQPDARNPSVKGVANCNPAAGRSFVPLRGVRG